MGAMPEKKDKIVPLRLDAATMQRKVRELAANSGNVFITNHARERMAERDVTRAQVIDCLLAGVVIDGPPFKNLHGSWQCTLHKYNAGNEVNVVVVLEDGVIVITVMTD